MPRKKNRKASFGDSDDEAAGAAAPGAGASPPPPPLVAAGIKLIKNRKEWDKLITNPALNHGLPIIADFYSTTCGPCTAIYPTFETLADDYQGRAMFVKGECTQHSARKTHPRTPTQL
mmetsp:Transcript_43324/g.117365  ORF Transcript_43324/g.117365 Transcript_43324/m.117365 type:complete len:118 (+) Transcript_43324:368-721(+)